MLRAFVDADASRAHRADGHVERPARLDAAEAGLGEAGVPVARASAPPLDERDLARVHSAAHVEVVRRACERGAWIDPDTYATPASWRAALVAAGLADAAARCADEGAPAFALPRPPGHHATPTRPMGFCLFNNVALAAEGLARQGRRVAVVDLDVHHGNGTQDAFYARDDVLFVSIHGAPLYPGTGHVEETGEGAGRGCTMNLPVPAGTDADGWLETLRAAAFPLVRAFAPDVLLVSVGFDGDHRDPIGNLQLDPLAFHAAVAELRLIQPRIAAVLEGGYDLEAVREGARAVAAALVGAPAPAGLARAPPGARPWPLLAERVARAHPFFGDARVSRA